MFVRGLEFCEPLWDGAALGARVCFPQVVPVRPQRHLLEFRVTGLKTSYTPLGPMKVWRSLRSEWYDTNVHPRLTMIYTRVFDSINSYSHVESCILMEAYGRSQRATNDKCLFGTNTYELWCVYVRNHTVWAANTAVTSNYSILHSSIYVHIFQNRRGHKELSDRYCITFIYLNFYKLFYPHRPALVAITSSPLASTHV